MTPDELKSVVRVYVDTVWNRRQVDRADECVAADFIDHSALPGQAGGLAGAKQKWTMYQAAIPDMRVTIDDMVAEGDKVAVRRSYTGTHQGPLFGVPPTGKALQFVGFGIFRLADGKIVEHWELFDRFTVLQQLGAVTPPDPS